MLTDILGLMGRTFLSAWSSFAWIEQPLISAEMFLLSYLKTVCSRDDIQIDLVEISANRCQWESINMQQAALESAACPPDQSCMFEMVSEWTTNIFYKKVWFTKSMIYRRILTGISIGISKKCHLIYEISFKIID